MNTPHELIQREATLLADLRKLIDERLAAEKQMHSGFRSRTETAEREYAEGRQRVDTLEQQEQFRLETEYADARHEATNRFESEHGPLDAEFQAVQQEIAQQYETDRAAARTEWEEHEWMTVSVWEGSQKGAVGGFEQWQRDVQERVERLRGLWEESGQLLEQYRQGDLRTEITCQPDPVTANADPLAQLQACAAVAEGELARMKQMSLPRLFKGWQLVWLMLITWGVLFGLALVKLPLPLAAAAGLAGTVVWGGLMLLVLRMMARKQLVASYRPLCQAIVNAEAVCQQGLAAGASRHKRQLAEMDEKRRREGLQSRQKLDQKLAAFERRRETDTRQAESRYPPRLSALRKRYDSESREIEAKYPRLLAELQARFQQEREQLVSRRKRQLELSQRSHDSEWKLLASNWQHGLQYMRGVAEEINQDCRRLFPAWDHPAWQHWQPPTDVPELIRIGEFTVSLAAIEGGLPEDERLRVSGAEQFTLPALAPFSDCPSILFRAAQQGREGAVAAMQNLMLRLLTSLPPGKVRFTIVDPVGLGQNFAAFMRLADHDEVMVTSRIWTEPNHIEQRLTDLTAQMENVIQKYLRNEFHSIEEYNQHAGEVAEPFRVLVIANFPQNFTEAAAQRLLSIAASGARCGVRLLASVDRQQPLPRGFDVRDMTSHALDLSWDGERFESAGSLWEGWPLVLDAPPEGETFRRILEDVGLQSRDARRVEVPFEFIAPSPEQWWTSDSRQGVHVPLGRAGATRRQPLKLGQGTSQHVLIAGKTGSGKSTLLHALITNLALMYSPEEIELYLIDFKKGVEFKTYAQHKLPHARVVAIESEREFGISVLERLDGELRRRGDMFRDAGVQDLAGFRDTNGRGPLPRIMLIVDEFQELFVEEDKLSQEAALLLDRLVRQGRAFGIHVLLGSQTLGGAYSLARSTIGQMAVRIALQCSEQDAHLILSEDNSAARLLSRPGEAIYNDSNGLVEGNHPFQIVWLSDERREEYLVHIGRMAQERGLGGRGQIIFEGNAPAEIEKNHLLTELLAAPALTELRRAPLAWLGESIAIKDPTAAEFAPLTGNNLLIVGQRDEASLAMMATSLVSLAAQHSADESGPRPAKFYILDGSTGDASYFGYLERLIRVLPHDVQYGTHRETSALVGQLYDEVERRQQSSSPGDPALYFFVFDLRRFRDLRKDDDDFSFSKNASERPSVAKQFAAILREGPALGVHTLAWCDALTTLQRTLERQSQREFETLVLFQMSPADSSQLIDTPAASKLGPHRALLYREDQARLEKFRPYGLPSEEWLESAMQRLAALRANHEGIAAAPPLSVQLDG